MAVRRGAWFAGSCAWLLACVGAGILERGAVAGGFEEEIVIGVVRMGGDLVAWRLPRGCAA